MKANLFDLLGIARSLADRAGAAKAIWPDLASPNAGISLTDDAEADKLTIVNALNAGTSFSNIRPGVDARATLGGGAPGQIAIAADMAITGAPATAQPFYLRTLPDMGILLMATDPMHPARVYAAVDGRGHEVIIDRLPVTLILKSGLATAITAAPVTVGTFDQTAPDSFAYTLGDSTTQARLQCFVRLHLTVEGGLILEPNVPLSLGPVRWMGLPTTAVYDIQILPSPNRREYLEWTHNDPGSFFSNPPAKGAIGFRGIALDMSQPPLSDLVKRLKNGAVHTDTVEMVLEDVVVPATVPLLPLPSHGTFGFRRKITDPGDIAQAYSLDAAPVQVQVYNSDKQGGNGGTRLTLEMDQLLFRTGDIHAIDPADQPQLMLKTALIWQNGTGPKVGGSISIDDQWTVAAGLVLDPATTPVKMTIADTTVGLVGLKFGLSISRLAKSMEFKDSFELLGDLFLQGKAKDPAGSSSAFQVTSLTGKPMSVVLHDIGWKLGNLSLSGLQMPDGMQLIFANIVHVIIEEMGWVEEPNGTPYFSFSGGVMIGGSSAGQSSPPKGNANDNSANGFGIRVRRLRFRLNSDGSQPFMKIDGVFLKLHYGPVDVEGFGYISDYTDSGWAIKEWGFGVKVALSVIAMQFSLAAMFLKGSRRNVSDPTQEFGYFLAALELGFLPAGPIGLYDIRALVADNMAPNLDSTFPDGEGMALLKWHQNHDNALSMPASRTLADWLAQKGAFAFGVGCGFSLNGAGGAAHLSVFIYFEKADANTGLLIVGELYLLKNPKPIAFVAIEYDIDKEKFGVMVGVDLSLGDFASGNLPSWLANIARLTGTLYFGNQPWSFAIGQLSDQSTWLSLLINFDIWLTIKFQLGVCVQIVDGGPKGFGVVVMLSAGADWGIGGFLLWGSFGLIIGTWKTGSDTSGLEFWIGLGFKINLFWIFSFGAEVNLKLTYLGKHPWYVTLHAEIKIDTPWFLPDITFSVDKTWQEPMPFDTASATQALSSGSAIDPTAQKGIKLLAPGLVGALGDTSFIYTFNQLTTLSGVTIPAPNLRDDIPIVSVDSTITIDFAQPVSNDTLIASTTYSAGTDAGVQAVQDLTIRYGLVSVSVRRAPRFGPTAGVWTDFITAADTTFQIGGVAPQTLTFAWDVDQRADGKLAPKRLLINSAAPYSFATTAAQNDEEAARNDADYPCCDARAERELVPKPHVLAFASIGFGARVPRVERFTGDNAAWWHWTGKKTPAVVPGDPVFAGSHTARIVARGTTVVGATDLPEPAALAGLTLAWDRLPGTLTFEAYTGLEIAGTQTINLREPGSTTVTLTIPAAKAKGFTRLLIRVEIDDKEFAAQPPVLVAVGFSAEAAVRVLDVAYVTLQDALIYAAANQRCKNGGPLGPPGSDASGKLAFLPNHDYEVVVTTAVRVGSKEQGPRETKLSEAVYFRTKGLPGLNAAPNVGDDIRRHVDRSYPMRRAIPLYRQEPCVLAFENSLSSVLPIDRTPKPGDPPEKAQMFPLELNVDRVASLDGLQRLTVPSNDWISAHRVNPYPPRVWVAGLGYAGSKVRKTLSNDPLVLRYEAAKIGAGNCGPQTTDHASQVLLHEPIGPDGSPGAWEPRTGYRATVRQKGGAFTERSGFDIYDLGAFVRQADGSAAAVLWSVDPGGAMVAPAAGGGRLYASCGELDWDHVQVRTHIDLRGTGAAGIAVGVADGTPVPQAILAMVEASGGGHAIVLRQILGGAETELARIGVAITAPFLLHVSVFDDKVRAEIGETMVEAPRTAVREGRVALVAQGPAAFAGISVGALDIYSFDFVTSRFNGFAAHLGSYDGKLPVLATGAFGGAAATGAAVLAAQGGAIAGVMTQDADPQARQALFSAVAGALGVGLSREKLGVTLSRVTDAGGTIGLVLQSPEPVSLTRDVALSLTRHVRTWVWDLPPWPGPVLPTPIPPPTGVSPLPGRLLPPLPPGPTPPGPKLATPTLAEIAQHAMALRGQPDVPQSVGQAFEAGLRFGRDGVELSAGAIPPDAKLVRVVAGPLGPALEVYSAPGAANAGAKLETLTLAQAAARPDLAAAGKLAVGASGIFIGGKFGWGHWEEHDVTMPFTALANGEETAALLLSPGGTAWPAGNYQLHAVMDRDRWATTGAADPEQHYRDEATLALGW